MGVKTAREIFFKTPEEQVIKGFDFNNDDLADGETITTVNTTTVTFEDTDPSDPNDLIVNSTSVVGGTTVQCELRKGIAGRTYAVKVRVTTSLAQILEAVGRIRVGVA